MLRDCDLKPLVPGIERWLAIGEQLLYVASTDPIGVAVGFVECEAVDQLGIRDHLAEVRRGEEAVLGSEVAQSREPLLEPGRELIARARKRGRELPIELAAQLVVRRLDGIQLTTNAVAKVETKTNRMIFVARLSSGCRRPGPGVSAMRTVASATRPIDPFRRPLDLSRVARSRNSLVVSMGYENLSLRVQKPPRIAGNCPPFQPKSEHRPIALLRGIEYIAQAISGG